MHVGLRMVFLLGKNNHELFVTLPLKRQSLFPYYMTLSWIVAFFSIQWARDDVMRSRTRGLEAFSLVLLGLCSWGLLRDHVERDQDTQSSQTCSMSLLPSQISELSWHHVEQNVPVGFTFLIVDPQSHKCFITVSHKVLH